MVCKWADDSRRFILENFDVIRNSPTEVYHYALPFSPFKSWLRECYSAELSQEVKVVKGLQVDWGTCSRTVSFDATPFALASWKGFIAVGLDSGNIIILNPITGIHTSAFFGHMNGVASLAFSQDGTFLVSGGHDKTTKLWDIQTGGVVKTFHGHTSWVSSVSISPDCTTIASGSSDKTVRLWGTWTGECRCVIDGHNNGVNSVSFSPTNSQVLVSISNDKTIQWWDINGHQIKPTCEGDGVAFSSDGTHLVSWRGQIARVQKPDSGVVIAKLQVSSDSFQCCCFSSDGKSVAGCTGRTIYVWDITNPDPHLINIFTGHTDNITSLIFSSSLVSSSSDQSIKFWQIGTLSTDPESTPLASASIRSVGLQANDGVAISSDSAGVARTWDISTGLCKATFHTPAKYINHSDIQLVGSRLIFVWSEHYKIHIWDNVKRESQMVKMSNISITIDLRISGDGSKVFHLDHKFIQAWSIWTGEIVGEVRLKGEPSYHPLIVDGSRVWVHFEDSQTQGWDFGIPGSTPVPISTPPPERPHLEFIGDTERWGTGASRIKDMVTGKEFFQLHGRYARPTIVQWGGQYLVAGYDSGEVLILDFNHMILQ